MENRSFYNEILTEHNVRPEFKHDLPDAVDDGNVLPVFLPGSQIR